MKAYDLKPSYENLLKTYMDDSIGRNTDLYYFISILNSIEDSCSISLDGDWGSGKTFFVNQAKMILDAHNEYINVENADDCKAICDKFSKYSSSSAHKIHLQPQVCVYYDAWKNDNDDDPILSLVYSIMSSVETDFSFKNTKFVDIGKNIVKALIENQKITQLIDSFKVEDPFEVLKLAKNIEDKVREFFQTLLPEKGNRLVVFVDELDRCRPSFAVNLLERIKHYFSDDQITFVFSVNMNQLKCTICNYYGNDFDGFKYLDRFFDLRLTLPAADMEKYYQSLGFYRSENRFDSVCREIINAYRFSLRETAKFLRLAKIAAYQPTHDARYDPCFPDEHAKWFCLLYIVPVIIALKLHNGAQYRDFIDGKDAAPLIDICQRMYLGAFSGLLGKDESFSPKDGTKTTVTLQSKLEEVYNAIFVNTYSAGVYQVTIGQLEFDRRIKDSLFKITSLLSQYNDLS